MPEYTPVFISAILAYHDAEQRRAELGVDHPATQNAAQRAHACLIAAAGTILRAREAAR